MYSISEPADLSAPLLYGVQHLQVDRRTRFIFKNKQTKKPVTAMCLYECYLSQFMDSPNSVRNCLSKLGYIFSWASLNNLDLNNCLCRGEILRSRDIRAFAHWLSSRETQTSKRPEKLSNSTFNSILSETSRLFVHFISQYAVTTGNLHDQAFRIKTLQDAVRDTFRRLKRKSRKASVAPDLSEQQVSKIEQYLRPDNRDKPRCVAVRDYIIWRLAIEFGLRIGEILALRIEDCPHRHKDVVSIVRIEERGEAYSDPRGAYSPRPKTLSRDLGFILKDSPLKAAISEYCMLHRRRKIAQHGKTSMKMVIDKPDFLILSHHNDCALPLSMSSAQNISSKISRALKFRFHWHLARHAFFNRAYSAIADDDNSNARIMDLVYWGGWSDPKSLQIYINRARRYRAEKELRIWQNGKNEWGALL